MRSIFLFLFLFSLQTLASGLGKLIVPEADIYNEANFDSDIITSIGQGESFQVSKKNYDGFLKIKLKSGKIGYVPDHEVEVDGKPFVPKPYVDEDQELELERKRKKSTNPKPAEKKDDALEDDDEPFDFNLNGFSLQLINLHEDTLGSLQVDDVIAIGYKHLSDASYEIFAAVKAPKYYTQKTSGAAEGFNLWGTYGINNTLPVNNRLALRYGGSIMAHYSKIKVTAPVKTYDLQDLSAGIVLEGALLVHIKKVAVDFSLKYFFDRNNYGGFGLSLLF